MQSVLIKGCGCMFDWPSLQHRTTGDPPKTATSLLPSDNGRCFGVGPLLRIPDASVKPPPIVFINCNYWKLPPDRCSSLDKVACYDRSMGIVGRQCPFCFCCTAIIGNFPRVQSFVTMIGSYVSSFKY